MKSAKKVKKAKKYFKAIYKDLVFVSTELNIANDVIEIEYDIEKVQKIQAKLEDAKKLILELRKSIKQ